MIRGKIVEAVGGSNEGKGHRSSGTRVRPAVDDHADPQAMRTLARALADQHVVPQGRRVNARLPLTGEPVHQKTTGPSPCR